MKGADSQGLHQFPVGETPQNKGVFWSTKPNFFTYYITCRTPSRRNLGDGCLPTFHEGIFSSSSKSHRFPFQAPSLTSEIRTTSAISWWTCWQMAFVILETTPWTIKPTLQLIGPQSRTKNTQKLLLVDSLDKYMQKHIYLSLSLTQGRRVPIYSRKNAQQSGER